MFEAQAVREGVRLVGRLDAAAAQEAERHLETLVGSAAVDMSGLEYISSAGLGVLLKTHKRLVLAGGGLHLVEVNPHIVEILHYSGFDLLFDVSPASS
ncbi:MAG: STAS domain-containing protein [Parahaliea sp.]